MTNKFVVLLVAIGMVMGFGGVLIPAGSYVATQLSEASGVPLFTVLSHGGRGGGGGSSAPTTYPGYIPIQIWQGLLVHQQRCL